MKLYRILLLFVLLASAPSLTAQSTSIQLAPEPIDMSGYDFIRVIGHDSSGYFVLLSNLPFESERDRIGLKVRRYQLHYYGKDLKIRWSKYMSGEADGRNLGQIVYFRNQVVLLSTLFEKNEGQVIFYMDAYSSSGSQTLTSKRIAASPVKNNAGIGKARLTISPDKKLLGVFVEEWREKDMSVHTLICDSTLNLISQSKAPLFYTAKEIFFSDVQLTNTKEIAVLGEKNNPSLASDKNRYVKFLLYLIPPSSNTLREYTVNEAGFPMEEASMVIDRQNQRIIAGGFYTDRSSPNGAGLLYASINLLSPDSISRRAVSINESSIKQLRGERNTGAGLPLSKYLIQRIILRNSGGAVLVAEAAYLSEFSYYDYFTQTYNRRIEFHFDNVVVIAIEPDGNILGGTLVRKEQMSIDDEGIYSSIATLLTSRELIILFNKDNGRFNEIHSHSIQSDFVERKSIISKPGENIVLIPRAGRQTAEREMIVPVITRKKAFLSRITL